MRFMMLMIPMIPMIPDFPPDVEEAAAKFPEMQAKH